MFFNDRLTPVRPVGFLSLDVFRRGKLIEIYRGQNLVVDTYKLLHARLIGGDVTDRSVTQIGFGTNGTAPAAGNTALTGAFIKDVDTITFPQTNQVQFNFSLGTGEANGLAILEFGLITENGTLYARRVRSAALNKASDITLNGSWLITF